ncbi:hem peroxidase [Arabidopsis thaliana x Arabidopsis arenosa]|uniref:peroxidase n=2 Tax=Arabidopsis TaxID=3701 RepID=A0A8T2EK12_ARASU|nr:hem peroxidase [Arabidopsis thaliana x Arabidopsis arenosa]KAG7622780.1 hem peroxidase [Arabidopsis suecica]
MRFLGDYKFALLTCSVIALSIYFAINVEFRFANDSPGTRTGVKVSEKSPFNDEFMYMSIAEDIDRSYLHYDYYRESCPTAEKIIAKAIRDIYNVTPSVAPSIIRLLFHDCFIEGCDASVLLDADEAHTSEKDASPNLSLKGFDVIDAVKSELENVCPGVVSCADLLVLAAREAVLVVNFPSLTLSSGFAAAYRDFAEHELPAPDATLSMILQRFSFRGFNERETVSLFGAHSIGITHCTFFKNRLYNFSATGKPDPELNPGFLQELKTKCPFSVSASSPSASPDIGLPPSLPASDSENSYGMSSGNRNDEVIDLSYNNEGGDENFGTRYFRRLMQNRGLMSSDQQLMGSEVTEMWVRAYASDPLLFRREFAMSMMKLSSYNVLTGPLGQVRTSCSKALPRN